MIRTSDLKTKYKELTDLGHNLYKVSWDYQEVQAPIFAPQEGDEKKNREIIGWESTDTCTYMYEYIVNPSINQIKQMIIDWYNKQTDEKILSGFVWNDMPVWLSTENQFNYKAAYDLAVQTQAQTLPVTFKFGDNNNPVYYTFETMGEFTDFYTKAMTYINTCLQEGWTKKDSINWDNYDTTKEA